MLNKIKTFIGSLNKFQKEEYFVVYFLFALTILFVAYLGVNNYNSSKNQVKMAEKNKSTLTNIQDNTNSISSENSPSNGSAVTNVNPNDFILKIGQINISPPIILNIDANNQELYMKALENGVVHMFKTALPGENGNVVVFGHSSFWRNRPGNFKHVFADLNKLKINDQIVIKNSYKEFDYTITSKTIVNPDQVDVVAQDLTQKTLTLITCWPVGTSKQRVVIVAKQSS